MRVIAHISDLHFPLVDPPVVEALVSELHGQSPALVVASGDFTQRARSRQFRLAAEFLARLPGPQLLVPGNHDIPLFDVVRRFIAPLDRYRQFITSDLEPVYEDEELLVVGINTARSLSLRLAGFWKDGRISDEQLREIELRTRRHNAGGFRIVVTHHPFIPPPGERLHGIVHNASRALDELEALHVDMLLAGHLHMGYSGDVRTHHEAVKRSILSIQAGTATSTRRRGEPNAYNLITTHPPNQITVQVRAWNGQAFVNADRAEFTRVDGVWHRED